jgi:5-oxoprolinase (ATP-hydrolysing)
MPRALWRGESAPGGLSRARVAEGFVRIAVENMANAIKQISIARGPRCHALHAAMLRRARAGQHACLVADALGMERVMIHPLAGVLPPMEWASPTRSS